MRSQSSGLTDIFHQLGLVAEISTTMMGFIAIFLVLSKSDGRFEDTDRHFIQALVLSSIMAIVLAVLPRALGLFFSGDQLWGNALIIAFVLGIGVMMIIGWTQWRMHQVNNAQIHWVWHIPGWAFGVISGVLMVIGIFGGGEPAAYYLLALYMVVAVALWCFIAVVFRRFF